MFVPGQFCGTEYHSKAADLEQMFPGAITQPIGDTEKGAIPDTWTGTAGHLCEQSPIDRQLYQYRRSWRDLSDRAPVTERD
ncbi:MAG: hypothetical protein V3W34_14995 [Phycisphaerae bacterium]